MGGDQGVCVHVRGRSSEAAISRTTILNTLFDKEGDVARIGAPETARGVRSVPNDSPGLFGNAPAERPGDRRVRRTRRSLREALLALVLEKGYDRVTVQDVIDRADVGRATFYAHFRDKDDLLASAFAELRASLRAHLASVARRSRVRPDGAFGLAAALFDHAARHRRLYRALVGGRGGAALLEQARRQLAAIVREHFEDELASRAATPPVALDVTVQYTVGAFLGVLTWWLAPEPPPHTPAQLGRMFDRLAVPGVRAGLGLPAPGNYSEYRRGRSPRPASA
jgi:AcrR family transcriptional regulator